jgi:NAD(P)-dependent dehydrogenase (short-subunit alcohol dehydrogenase family)
MQLPGLRVVITGAASGIGRTVAGRFVAAGASVHVCDIDPDAIAALAEAAPEISSTIADVSSPKDVDRVFEDAEAHMGGLDTLINNAGPGGPTLPVDELSVEEWRACLGGNLDGMFLCTRRAAPLLKREGAGSIVNMSSVSGLFGSPLRSPYAAAKWAALGLTKTWASELGPHGIRVNAVCPGGVGGERLDRQMQDLADSRGVAFEEVATEWKQQASLRTFIDPDDIADLILFLCSPAAKRITGAVVPIDGHLETLVG